MPLNRLQSTLPSVKDIKMKKHDQKLGMNSKISRRDFIHDVSLASLGISFPGIAFAESQITKEASAVDYYPPIRTGLRGSHPGAFENAHMLAREGKNWSSSADKEECYDLVIVGGGISGLASAYFYRKQNPSARVLILENHDDFGGHAKRNEFHQGGNMRLAWGGTMNLEYTNFSDTVNQFLSEIGVDIERLKKQTDFHYGYDGIKGPAIYFDKETYGRDVLSVPCSFRDFSLDLLLKRINEFPVSDESQQSLRNFASARRDIRKRMSSAQIHHLMHKTSYIEFLLTFGKLTQEAADLFVKTTDGYWGVSAHSLSVSECIGAGLPIEHLLGGKHQPSPDPVGGAAAMFPDGNSSIARLLVRRLIPEVASGNDMDDIVSAKFDYSKLDKTDSSVKVRLNSTVINVQHEQNIDDQKIDDQRECELKGDSRKENDRKDYLKQTGVTVSYIRDSAISKVKAKHCILACYHSNIPHLCPQLPDKQKEAAKYQVKRPLLLTNVLLKNSKAVDKLGISGAYCPGRMHGACWLVKGVSTKDYQHDWSDDGPVSMMFWGSLAPSNNKADIKTQHRDSRLQMLALKFEDYEREVRSVLNGMLGPAGFDVQNDILAITVNRWPHGYSYDYLDLWDPKWAKGEAPHEIARLPFGNIAIANSDAGANAMTEVAIDEAYRAVNDLLAK